MTTKRGKRIFDGKGEGLGEFGGVCKIKKLSDKLHQALQRLDAAAKIPTHHAPQTQSSKQAARTVHGATATITRQSRQITCPWSILAVRVDSFEPPADPAEEFSAVHCLHCMPVTTFFHCLRRAA